MPGLFGVITQRPPDEVRAEIGLMLSCVKHEPFYATGSYSVESQGLYVGWTVHERSFSDCMPIVDSAHNRTMFFSGQHFPDENVLSSLRSKGSEGNFKDTSYLLDAYELDKRGFFSSLNGWFCGVLADTDKGEVHLFNDRFGIGRLYIYEAPDSLYFASEAKALLKVRKELRQIDLQGMGEFFACDCALENRTLFRDVSLLPGGSLWTFHAGLLVRKSHYFKPGEWKTQPSLSSDSFLEELDSTFARLLPRYLDFQEPAAISLTGGLDTRMILAYLDRKPGDFPCYTFAGNGKDTFDLKIARSVAKACGHPHSTIRLGPEFFANFPYYAERTVYISDGCHDICGAHDLYLNAIAREIAPARLTGKFGSEVLRGVRMLSAHPPALKIFEPSFRPYVDNAATTLRSIDAVDEVSFTSFAAIPWYEYGRLAIEQSQLTFITPYMDNDLVRLTYRGRHAIEERDDIPVKSIQRHLPGLLDIPTDRGYQGKGLGPSISRLFYGTFLFKGDWFFHYMPHKYAKIGAFLERLGVQHLFHGRHYMLDYRSWLRDEFKAYVGDMLLDPGARVRRYLDGPILDKMVRSHLNGEGCYLEEINKALTVELIHRQLIEME
jgi:asparagine synthase (glutamine-hydrolysing)